MAQFILILFAVAALGFLCWLSWISFQSLQQAAVLRRASRAGLSAGEAVAVHGSVDVITPVSRHGFRDALWCRLRHQEKRGYGKNRRWRTVDTEEHLANFKVTFSQGSARIEGLPTEVQATRRSTDYGGAMSIGGFLGFGRRTRTIHEWLPLPPRITVVGRLEARGDAGVFVKDPRVGLLLSPREPKAAARVETAKGIAGFVLVTAGIAAALYYYTGLRP